MIGLAPELSAELAKRGFTEQDVLRLFSREAHKGDLRIIYQRSPSSDRTAGLPSSRHLYYVSKGWVAVAVVDEDLPVPVRGEAPSPIAAVKK